MPDIIAKNSNSSNPYNVNNKIFESIQKVILEEVNEKVKISSLSYKDIGSFLSNLLSKYDGSHIITMCELDNYFDEMRRDSSYPYIPHVFRHCKSYVSARKVLLEYLNILFFDDFKNLYGIQFSEQDKYYI